jgi:signal transduction histidine kinase
MDGSTMNPKAIFSFESMGQYLAPGESLKFFPPGHDLPVEVFANGSSSVRDGNRSALSKLASIIVELVTPAVSTQKAIQLSNGGKIELQGNPALVLGGWSAAAKAIIAFAFIFGVILVLSGFAIYYFVVAPLNHVRRNTIYMRGRYSDAEDFKLPHTISNRHDEIGVLWVSIEDLHRSITTYGREALEHAKKESDLLRAIGHEIKSPLQDLLLRHNNVDDPSAKSLKRISYALKTLSNTYSGQSSEKVVGPKEAISSSRGNITKEDVSEYLENAAESSDGIITFNKSPSVLYVSADGDMLEASLMAVLNNAKEFRKADTNIVLQIFSDSNWVLIHISNQGPHIPFYPIEEVFEYGVSSRDAAGDHQGLGLFIAKQYITKMGGDIAVKNVKDGVRFEIKLARAH